ARNVHSADVAVVDEPWAFDHRPDADAVVTTRRGIVLASDSADCPIVLFADGAAGVIGIAHAGWKGAKKGVLAATVEQMIALGAQAADICACVGPCIAQASYEVGPEFYQSFLAQDPACAVYFASARRAQHWQFDLLGYVQGCLKELGLKAVSAIGLDTYADEERFFSCRRALHRGEPDFGGHLSCICLK
ncbi:MAG TPA: polyphenol oxidase family protein, partial [Opitutales bacterium]|nr:polyphenol oxidase family protein [Opitutales bacterium]